MPREADISSYRSSARNPDFYPCSSDSRGVTRAQWPAEIGVVTLANPLFRSPAAVTALLSQMPIALSAIWLRVIVVVTRVPPENTRTPVVFRSWGLHVEFGGSPACRRRGCSCR